MRTTIFISILLCIASEFVISQVQIDIGDSDYTDNDYKTAHTRIEQITSTVDHSRIEQITSTVDDTVNRFLRNIPAPYPVQSPSSSDKEPPVRTKKKDRIEDKKKKGGNDSKKLKKGGKGKGKGKGSGSYEDDYVYSYDDDYTNTGKGKGKGINKKEGKGKGKGGGGGGGGGYDDDEMIGKGKGGGVTVDDDIYLDPPTRSPAGGGGEPGCQSTIAQDIEVNVKKTIAINPSECCSYDGPIAAYVTHAIPDPTTSSGFEPFWDAVYSQIATTSLVEGVCFVFVGVLPEVVNSELSTLLINANIYISSLPDVTAMMVTDPTDSVELINTIRSISDGVGLPSIGLFNTGYANVIIESVVNGNGRLPYVGYLDNKDYGQQAARISLNLLEGLNAVPLCFNSRIGVLDFIGERCAAYYDEITESAIDPLVGVECSAVSDVNDIYNQIVDAGANAVWSHVDCCSVVADAVQIIRENSSNSSKTIVVGCQDNDTSGGKIDFVTTQPVTLQAYSAASWNNFPVQQSQLGKNGRLDQYFPSLQSVINTAIFNVLID